MSKVAARLYKAFQPESYDLYLKIDPDKMEFDGRVIIFGKKTGAPSKRIVFHQKDLKIKSAKITRLGKDSHGVELARINTHKSLDEVRLHTKETLHGGPYQIEVNFSGKITEAMHGIYPAYFDKRRKKLIATQLESHHAREVFPSIDEPEAKAIFILTLETPESIVIGNTPIKAQSKKADQMVTVFEPSPKMSSYLLAFVVGEVVWREAKSKNGLLVRTYATPANKKMLDFSLKTAVKVVEFFEDYFGVEYPLPKLDLIGLPDFSSGAMENWGLITFRESIFLSDPKTTGIETKQFIALVIAHEIAHQWFGNLVTMKWWDDLWLNESFANLMEYVVVDALFPQWRVWEQFVNGEMAQAFRRDSLPGVQAVRTKVRHPDELATLFDPAIVYAKGGSILSMVRNLIGDQAFRRGLKIYFDKHRYGNTVAADLWSALSQTSGRDINAFMDNWLNKPGFPVVEIEHQPSTNSFKASQRRLLLGGQTDDKTTWQVPLPVSGLAEPYLLKNRTSDFELTVKNPPVFNDEGRAYFIARYSSADHFRDLLDLVRQAKLSPINRLQLISGQSLLERALIINTSQNLDLTLAYKNEDEEAVWSATAGVLADAKRLVMGDKADEANHNRFTADLVNQLVKKVGWEASPSDSSQRLKLRNLALSLAAAAEVKEIIAEGKKRFAKFNHPSDLAPDIRDVIYFIAVRFGTQSDFKKLLSAYKQIENADERNEIAAALTSTREPKQIAQLIKLLKSEHVRLQDTASWYVWLLRNYYARATAWQWLTDNWQWIEDNFGSDKSYDNFPRYSANVFSTKTEFESYKKFFKPKLRELALERAIRLGLEEIEGRLKWRSRNESAVKKWLVDFKA